MSPPSTVRNSIVEASKSRPLGTDAAATDADRIVDMLLGPSELDIVAAERILAGFRRQAKTIAGYPRLRPSNFVVLTRALEKAFESNRSSLVLGDRAPALRFDALIEAYAATDVRQYPRELFQARLIQAEVRLLLSDYDGVREAVGHYLDNPYALEAGFDDLAELFQFDCRLRASTHSSDEVGRLAMTYTIMLVRLRPRAVRSALMAMAPYLGLGSSPLDEGVLRRGLHWAAAGRLQAQRGAGWLAWPLQKALKSGYSGLAYLCLLAIRYSPRSAARSQVLATRAMGGIGDLLMMTPGLRALAKTRSQPVRLAIPRKFFAIFENNPHVELLDIDATQIETGDHVRWRNLTICPAAAYESTRRPWVRKSRVELFAKGLGVRASQLARWGDKVELFLDARQREAAAAFVRAKGLGSRPLVGVQPYSRDSYKDHPGINAFIEDLARDYDVLVFHHTDSGLPSGPGIATTAGLPLSLSLALVSRLGAMVSCDSAFLHAAGAFDVPVFAMFGPTDGSLFTRHHRFATVFQNKTSFPCSPCWRNEDIPLQGDGPGGDQPVRGDAQLRAGSRRARAGAGGARFEGGRTPTRDRLTARDAMRRLIKFLHTMGSVGFMGSLASLLVLARLAPPPQSLAGYALIRSTMAEIAAWVVLPSLILTLVPGLLAIAVTRAFHDAGWAWLKAATGIVVFAGGLHALAPTPGRGAARGRGDGGRP